MAQSGRVTILPGELVDAVIDNLKDDPATLAAAGLVAKVWCERTRAHLFHRIKLGERGDPHVRCAKMRLALRKRPHLFSYVKALSLNLGDLRYWSDERVMCGDFIELVDVLRCLTEVEIIGAGDFCRWDRLPSPVQATLYDLFGRASITSVKISMVSDIDISVLAECQQITELTLYRVGSLVSYTSYLPTIRNATPSQPPAVARSPMRRLLDITLSDDASLILAASAKYTGIVPNFARPTVLRIGQPNAGVAYQWQTILERFGPAVEELWASDFSTLSQIADYPLVLSLLPRLRRLGFVMPLESALVYLAAMTQRMIDGGQFRTPTEGGSAPGLVLEVLVDAREPVDVNPYNPPHHPEVLGGALEALGNSPDWVTVGDAVATQGSALSKFVTVCVSLRVDGRASRLVGRPCRTFQDTLKRNLRVLDEGCLEFQVYRA